MFEHRMPKAELDYVLGSTAMQTAIAENYVGLPLLLRSLAMVKPNVAQLAVIRRETFLSVVINAAISAAVFTALFFRSGDVVVGGLSGMAAVCVPQAFMVALTGSLIAALLTRRRVVLGGVAPLATEIANTLGFQSDGALLALIDRALSHQQDLPL